MDPVATWKASSIVLTGAFGILGLLTEFKDEKTKRVTRWGYISLVGIVVSTVLGTVFQLKESEDSATQALNLATSMKQTLESTSRTLESTKQIAEGTRQTVESTEKTAVDAKETLGQVERLLVPIDQLMVTLDFGLPCSLTRVQSLCETVYGYGDEEEGQVGDLPWSDGPLAATLFVRIFRDPKSAEHFVSWKAQKAQKKGPRKDRSPNHNVESGSNLVLRNNYDTEAGQKSEDGIPQVSLINYELSRNDFRQNDRTFLSVKDLIGATVVVQIPADGWDDDDGKFRLDDFSMSFRNGVRLVGSGVFRRIPLEEGSLYLFTLREL